MSERARFLPGVLLACYGMALTGCAPSASPQGVPTVTIPYTAEPTAPAGSASLADPDKKEIAMELVSSAENSTTDWREQY